MSTTETALEIAATRLQPWAQSTATAERLRLDVTLKASDLIAAVSALNPDEWGYLAAITGLDRGVEAGLIDVLYHFCAGAAILTLRVSVPRSKAVVPSLCALIPSASLFERELMEMFGVTVSDTPDATRLFLPDDWPAEVFPLRKDALVAET